MIELLKGPNCEKLTLTVLKMPFCIIHANYHTTYETIPS